MEEEGSRLKGFTRVCCLNFQILHALALCFEAESPATHRATFKALVGLLPQASMHLRLLVKTKYFRIAPYIMPQIDLAYRRDTMSFLFMLAS